MILEEDGFVALCPFAPRFPFETWILPAGHRSDFEDISLEELLPLARVISRILGRMAQSLDDPPFNLMLHSAPLRAQNLDHFHWHIEIIPKLTRVAGFEWGTGFFSSPRKALAGRGNSSVVEHNLAKVGVAGSNPVSRSIRNGIGARQRALWICRAA